MALVRGTNCGFVTTAPSADPAASTNNVDDYGSANRDTTPAGINTVTEIGWWLETAVSDVNFEVGIYTHDSTNNHPDTLVGVDRTNSVGTTSLVWKRVPVSIPVNASTIYWIAIQVDDTASNTNMNYATPAGLYISDTAAGATTLPDPWTTEETVNVYYSIYALVENIGQKYTSINIGDVWKTVSGSNVVKVNVGDVWKNVSAVKVNVGDVWKAVTII